MCIYIYIYMYIYIYIERERERGVVRLFTFCLFGDSRLRILVRQDAAPCTCHQKERRKKKASTSMAQQLEKLEDEAEDCRH